MLSSRSLQVNIGSEQPQREDGTHLWTDHKKVRLRTSLVVQWLRILLPMQGMWVRSLVRKLRSHMCCALSLSRVQLFATPWTSACQAPLPTLWSSWACTLKLEGSRSGQKKKKECEVECLSLAIFSCLDMDGYLERDFSSYGKQHVRGDLRWGYGWNVLEQ